MIARDSILLEATTTGEVERYAGLVRAGDEIVHGGVWVRVEDIRFPGRFDVVELTVDSCGESRKVRAYVDDVLKVRTAEVSA